MIVVQFSMSFSFACRFRKQPVYYITVAFVCQEVFQNFFKFFRGSFRFPAASCRQPVYYITAVSVCQEVFQTFFRFFDSLFSFASLSRKALSLYHTHPPLSSPFCMFFAAFCRFYLQHKRRPDTGRLCCRFCNIYIYKSLYLLKEYCQPPLYPLF